MSNQCFFRQDSLLEVLEEHAWGKAKPHGLLWKKDGKRVSGKAKAL